MADTITIRLDADQRRRFDEEASARGVGPSTLARDLLNERLREIRRAQIWAESEEAGKRYQAAVAAGQDIDLDGLDPLVWDAMAPYEGEIGGSRP